MCIVVLCAYTDELGNIEMKDKVIKLLIKWGYNEDAVKSMVESNFDIAVKSYPDAKPSFIADVVCTL